jgi:putative aldouronate transport system substrate-binding protein
MEQSTNYYALQDAISRDDPSQLTGTQLDLWNSYRVIVKGETVEGLPYAPEAWGLYYSRVARDGGWGVTMDIKDEGAYIFNEYYGDPTPTELARSSTLNDMWVEFSARYIMGDVPESEWDAFVNNWKTLGGDDWTREANEQYSRMK